MTDAKRNPEESATTASWRITVAQKTWIEDEAKRREVKQSAVVREVIDRAMAEAEPQREQAAA